MGLGKRVGGAVFTLGLDLERNERWTGDEYTISS
jgi:hypothetical protein